jgi:hypothetical protein
LLAFHRERSRTWQGRIFPGLIGVVRAGNPGERDLSWTLALREIFVSLEMDCDPEFALCRENPSDSAAATHSHTLGQSDFGWHHESQLHRITFRDPEIGVEKCSAATQILGKAAALMLRPGQANGDWNLEGEALRCTALKVNLIAAHGFSDGQTCRKRPDKPTSNSTTLLQRGAVRKL